MPGQEPAPAEDLRAEIELLRDRFSNLELRYGDLREDFIGLREELREKVAGYTVKTVKVELDSTGSESCHELGMECIALTSTRTVSGVNAKFCGYGTPSCNSRVKKRPKCNSNGTDFVIDRVDQRLSREHEPGAICHSNEILCLRAPSYEYAICIGGSE